MPTNALRQLLVHARTPAILSAPIDRIRLEERQQVALPHALPMSDSNEKLYWIKKRVLGRVPAVEIGEERFAALVRARQGISETLGIEEKYDLLVENYLEYTTALLTLTSALNVRPRDDLVRVAGPHRHSPPTALEPAFGGAPLPGPDESPFVESLRQDVGGV